MKNIYILLATFVLLLSSCATLFDSKRTNIRVITSEPSRLVIDQDTLINLTKSKLIVVKRDKKPLLMTVYNDSLTRSVNVSSRNSFAYWLNIYPISPFWIGFLIDTKTKRRYTYPKTVYIDFLNEDNTYLTYEPFEKPNVQTSNIFKITPLKTLAITNPGIELSYERRTGRSFSTQIMVSYLLPMSIINIADDLMPNIKGFKTSIEEKFYLQRSAPSGSYLSLELDYLKNQYRSNWSFIPKETDSDTEDGFESYFDTFGVKKQTYSLNLKFGYQILYERLALDLYTGLGIRYKDVVHFDRTNPHDEMESPRHPNVHYSTNIDGKYWTVNIPLNIKIGWHFNK